MYGAVQPHNVHVSAVREMNQPWQDMFKPEVYSYLSNLARSHMISVPFLCTSLVTAVTGTYEITTKIKIGESKWDSGCLYSLIVGESGSGKSVCHSLLIKDGIARIGHASDNDKDKIICENYTVAGLKDHPKKHDGKIFISFEEGETFLKSMQQRAYSAESEKGVLNKFFDGEGDAKTMLTQTRVLEKTRCTLQIFVQPAALLSYLENEENLTTGLISRFLIISPDPRGKPSFAEGQAAMIEMKQQGKDQLLLHLMVEMSQIHQRTESVYMFDNEGMNGIGQMYDTQCQVEEESYKSDMKEVLNLAMLCETKGMKLTMRLAVALYIVDTYLAEKLNNVTKPVQNINPTVPVMYILKAKQMYLVFSAQKAVYLNAIVPKNRYREIHTTLTNRQKIIKKIVAHGGAYIKLREFRSFQKTITSDQLKMILNNLEISGLGHVIKKDKDKLPMDVFCKIQPEKLNEEKAREEGIDILMYRAAFYKFTFIEEKANLEKVHPGYNDIKTECTK